MLNDDELPDEAVRSLRTSRPLDSGAEDRLVSLLARRGILRRAGRMVSPLTVAIMAAAAVVVFLVGVRTGERLARRNFEGTALGSRAAIAPDTSRKGPPASGEVVLWF